MKKSPIASKLALAGIFSLSLIAPAQAHMHHRSDMCDMKRHDHHGTECRCDKDMPLESTHVDFIKRTVAPHANLGHFKATGQLSDRDNFWEGKVEPGDGQKLMMAEKHEMMMHDKAVVAPVHKPMKKKHMHRKEVHDMKNMTPEQRAAAKARWEQRKAEWNAMTPEQKAAAKARWEAERASQ